MLYLKCLYYLANGCIAIFNQLILYILFVSVNKTIFGNIHKAYSDYQLNFMSSYEFLWYYNYLFMPIWTICYTNSSLLDIVIAYERILMYLPNVKFMRNKKIYLTLLIILVLSCLINLPVNLSRGSESTTLNFNISLDKTLSKLTTKVYFGERRALTNTILNVFVFISAFIRDIITIFIELSITVFLLYTIVKFYNRRRRVLNPDQNSDPIIFRKTDMNNSKFTFYICLVSSFNHIITFSSLIVYVLFNSNVYLVIITISGVIFWLKHSLNFFILFKLNKKFKRNCISLIPNWLKIKRNKKNIKKVTSELQLRNMNECIYKKKIIREAVSSQNQIKSLSFKFTNVEKFSVIEARKIKFSDQSPKVENLYNSIFETHL